jgi:hypothetical protein
MPPLHSLSPCALSYLLSLFFHTFTSWGYAATGGDKKGATSMEVGEGLDAATNEQCGQRQGREQ